jgi:hypothetical protein
MRKIALVFLFLTFIVSIPAQQNNEDVFTADLNGNGKRDRIVTVRYKKRVRQLSWTDRTKCEMRISYFAKYVLYLDNRKKGTTIFEYLYGDDEAQYWQYGIDKAVDLNKDGIKDLVFSAGDDTSEEYIYLIRKPTYTKAIYLGAFDLDEFVGLNKSNDIILNSSSTGKFSKIFAKWNPKREVFEGRNIKWVNKDCIGMYAEPNGKSKLLHLLMEGGFFDISDEKKDNRKGWQKIKMETFDESTREIVEIEGWVETHYLSATSPTEIFPIK